MTFKVNWAANQFIDFKGFCTNKAVLKSPLKFYLSIVLMAIPGLYRKPVFLNLLNGYNIIIQDFMAIYIYKEIFIDKCYANLSFINNHPVVIDVGANIGLFMLWIKSTYPDSKILSIEPYKPNFDTLLETIRINKIKNVTPIQKAVLDVVDKIKLFIHPTNSGGHSLFEQISGHDFVEVETTTIESIFTEHNITICDLLKLDCEGSEYIIIKSLTKEIAAKIRNIIIEPIGSLYSIEELTLKLEEFGYKITSQQNLIIASKEIVEN